MKTVKTYLKKVPTPVWIVLGIALLVGLFWLSDDIGSWWEKTKQAAFDKQDAKTAQIIDGLTKERDAAIIKAEEAEAREQAKIIEVDLLRQEIAKRGINIEEAQKRIDEATNEYENDVIFIERVKAGLISKYELCVKQCEDSAKLGYPCRQNYCIKFKE